MRHPIYDMSIFKERRQKLAARLPKNSAFILCAQPEQYRNNDVPHAYRQDTNFFYFTGFEEPDAVLVFRPGQSPETVMFTRPKDLFHETWNGFRYGPEAAEKEFGIDKAFVLEDFDKKIVELLKPAERIYYRWNLFPEFDHKMLALVDKVRTAASRSGRGNLSIHDSWEEAGEIRVLKTKNDVETMRKACEYTSVAHVEAMRFTKPGVNERQLKGLLLGSFLRQGCDREGYGTIVASGANATTLHYVYNDQTCKAGDLVLVDAGGEYQYYTGDITRTYPVNGKFTASQRRVYEPLLGDSKNLDQTS